MKYYINENKELFGIEQGQENLIKDSWTLCEVDEDGKPYRIYNLDGTPDLVAINELATKEANDKAIAEAKAYLANTDYKMLPNYVPKADEDLDAIIVKRNETREFIRNNNA